jgi:hypothetical protein
MQVNHWIGNECVHDHRPHLILIFSVPLCLCGEKRFAIA